MIQTFASVWDAIEDTPEQAAAMKVRANLMSAIEGKVRSWKVTQREAAKRLGVTQPRLNDLLVGKISKFSLDALVTLAARVGLAVKVVEKRRRAA
jgi:predicted XRE-type DNA-binding protein